MHHNNGIHGEQVKIMKTRWLCPHCKQETNQLVKSTTDEKGNEKNIYKQFIFPMDDGKGNVLWKNVFHIDWVSIGIIIGIILLVFGFRQINLQCYDIVEHPCEKLAELGCNEVMIGEEIQIPEQSGVFPPTTNAG